MPENRSGALTETTFLILLALYRPNYGYGIMHYVEEETRGRVKLSAGTLYGALNTLLERRLITPFPSETDDGRKRYVITREGKDVARAELNRLSELWNLASSVIAGEKIG